jgi:hypothetical protein
MTAKQCRDCLRDDLEFAFAELHYTSFEDAETFHELRRRHGLKRADWQAVETQATARSYAWEADDGLVLFTNADPVAGTHPNDDATGREGYCSYVSIDGPAAAAEALFRDIVETAERIKGEFQPLTTDDGDEIASYWSIVEGGSE